MENFEMDIDYVDHVEAQIVEIINARSWWTGNFEKINKTVCYLEKLICCNEGIDSSPFARKILNEVTLESLKIMNDGYCRWETEIENQFALKILKEPETEVNDYFLYDRFYRLLSKEIDLLDGLSFDSLMFIGSGPFPITAILLHKLTGKKVDCLEMEKESAEISRLVIEKLGLSDFIHIHIGNGSTFDLSEYDVVLIALLAKPKSEILRNVRERGNTDCKIICRTSEGLRTLLYEPTPAEVFRDFSVHGSQRAGYDDTISSVVLSLNKISPQNLEFEWVESLQDQDLESIVEMYNKIIESDNNNGFTNHLSSNDYYFMQLKQDIKAGFKKLLIIKDKRHFYGQLIINLFHHHTYSHRADISSLMLHKSIRSKSVSLRVAECLINECDRLNLELVTIDVRADTKQEKLWKYLGFETYGELPKYSMVNKTYHAGILMFQEIQQMKHLLKRRLGSMYEVNQVR